MVPRDVVRRGKFVLASGPIIISLVLVLLTCVWLFVVHVIRFSKNWIIFEACDFGWTSSVRMESSTYLTMEQPAERSLMRTRNDRGPKQEPTAASKRSDTGSWNRRGNDNLGWNDLQMYFKVIKNDTNRKLVYDFLLVVYSNFCRITLLPYNIPYTLFRNNCRVMIKTPMNQFKANICIKLILLETRIPGLPFFRNLMWNSPMTLKYAQGQWQSYYLKLSCGHVRKMFGRQWPNEPKIAISNYPIFNWRPLSSEPQRISA